MIASEVREMLSFIDGNPTAYHTTAAVRDILLKAGFAELLESRKWALEPGKDYFVCRNGSSIIAFRMGDQLENYSFNVAAAHTDSPCFRIKENAEIHMGQNYTKLNTLSLHDALPISTPTPSTASKFSAARASSCRTTWRTRSRPSSSRTASPWPPATVWARSATRPPPCGTMWSI